MRVAALARDRVDRLHVVRAHLVEHLVGQRDDVVLAHAGFQLFVDHVIDAIDHAGRLGQQLDLVPVLDLARRQHDLLAVDHLDALLLQRVEHGRFGIVDAHRHVGHARVLDQPGDLLGIFLHQPELGRDRAAHAHHAGEAVIGLQPVGVFLVMHRRRAEIPDIGAVVARSAGRSGTSCPAPTRRSWSPRRSGCCSHRRAAAYQRRSSATPAGCAIAGSVAAGRGPLDARNQRMCAPRRASALPTANSVPDPAGVRMLGSSAFIAFPSRSLDAGPSPAAHDDCADQHQSDAENAHD